MVAADPLALHGLQQHSDRFASVFCPSIAEAGETATAMRVIQARVSEVKYRVKRITET